MFLLSDLIMLVVIAETSSSICSSKFDVNTKKIIITKQFYKKNYVPIKNVILLH